MSGGEESRPEPDQSPSRPGAQSRLSNWTRLRDRTAASSPLRGQIEVRIEEVAIQVIKSLLHFDFDIFNQGIADEEMMLVDAGVDASYQEVDLGEIDVFQPEDYDYGDWDPLVEWLEEDLIY